MDKPTLYKTIRVPDALLSGSPYGGGFGGDIRVGDLAGDGRMDLVVYRTVDGVKPCCIGAFTQNGEVLWQHGEGGGQPARPGPVAVHDIDGTVLWERQLGRNMDSVAMDEWDDGHVRAFCSGYGHVMDHEGNAILALGKDLVPHGQELRTGRFDPSVPGPQMIIRYKGHSPDVMLVGVDGNVIRTFRLNDSPNHTGMETVYWHGPDAPALLYHGGMLWQGNGHAFARLPDLPPVKGNPRQGWYHCIPVHMNEAPREDILVYNPWDRRVFLFTREGTRSAPPLPFTAGPRQYNPRLMD